MGSISYAIPQGSSIRAEVAQHVRGTRAEVIASNSAPGDGYDWGGTYFAAHREEFRPGVGLHHLVRREPRRRRGQDEGRETTGPTAVGVGATVLAALAACGPVDHPGRAR